jgi:hypothetical protein
VDNTQSTSEARNSATSTVVQPADISAHDGAGAQTSSDERFMSNDVLNAAHPAKAVWSYVEQMDFGHLREAIGEWAEIEPTDLRVLMSLWLYACIEGVGSARQVALLSETHPGFRWLRRGQILNHQMLSDFRWDGAAIVDKHILHGLVSLWSEGLVSIASLSDGCVRVRASNALKFRRLATFDYLLAAAEERILRLRQEIETDLRLSRRRLRAVG